MKQYLLIDIGGTFIKYSLADEQARKISGGKVPTPLTNMDDLLAVIEGFAAPLQGQFVGCAISMPGRIDTRNGIAHTGGMLSTFMWEQPFAAQVEARLGVPVTIANDGKCAAAAEGWTGALAGVENGLVLVLGTGIGGGIILNGKMFNGGMNHGVELGHAYLVDGGEPCTCGNHGCMEAYCAASALTREGRRAMQAHPESMLAEKTGSDPAKITPKLVTDCAKAGDPAATAVFDDYIEHLSSACASIYNILDPEVLALGGGLSAAGPFLFDPLQDKVSKKCFYSTRGKLVPAVLGNEAGMIGAALLARDAEA